MRSMMAFVCALLMMMLGCLPAVAAEAAPEPASRVEQLVARGGPALLDVYLLAPGPEAEVRAVWAPVWERWEALDEALRAYRAALDWGEVAREGDDVVEAYCALLAVTPPSLASLREPALCVEVAP